MTKNNYPITPPSELVLEWCKQWNSLNEQGYIQQWIADQAALWAWNQRATSDLNKPQEAKDESNKPTDEELVKTVKQSMEDCIFISELIYYNCEPLMQILRAVLARWGNHPGSPDRSLQPVPVSERLPGPKDCDNAERVWCWSWAINTWRLNRINQSIHSHWLPAHALPLPS